VTVKMRHGDGPGCGSMGLVVGVKPFSNVVRAAIHDRVVMMVSRSSKHGAHWTILREVC
jgi:hypothetical protein